MVTCQFAGKTFVFEDLNLKNMEEDLKKIIEYLTEINGRLLSH